MPKTPTQALSSANVLTAATRAGNAARALWDALCRQAVSVQPNALTFADGSTLRFIPQSSSYVAL